MATIAPPAGQTPATAVPIRSGQPRKSPMRRLRDGLYPYSYIAPSIGFMAIASFFPIAFTIILSFTNYGAVTYVNGNPIGHITSFDWVGFQNYVNLFTDRTELGINDFGDILVWTAIFAAVTTALCFTGGLLLAILLNNEHMRERNIYRTLLIIPWALPGAIAIMGWSQGILNQPFGLAHVILQWLGLPNTAQPEFLLDPNWARFAVFMVGYWFGFPFMMTACLGALQSISPEILQAAEIDGANFYQKFFRVTLPLLRQATLPLVISTFAYNLNNFGTVYLLTAGQPPSGNVFYGYTDILSTVVYKLAYNNHLYFLACTYGVLIFFIIGGFSFINMKISGAFEQVK